MLDKCFNYLVSVSNGQKSKIPTEMEKVVRNCVYKLPRLQRNILLLHYWEDKGLGEIACELNKRQKTIAKAFQEGLVAMKASILDELDLEEVTEEVEIKELAEAGAI